MNFALASRPARLSRSTAVPLSRISGSLPLLNAIVDFLPSPMDRASRTPLEGLRPDTSEAVSRRADQEDPFSGVVFKTLIDPFVGRLSYLRVLSGVLHADSTVFNSSRGSKEKSGRISIHCSGKKRGYGRVFSRRRGDRGHWKTSKIRKPATRSVTNMLPSVIRRRYFRDLCCPLQSSRSPTPISRKSVSGCIS